MQSEAKAKALEQFTDYFVKNYPGPDTIIYDPKWHAPKIFAAAHHAITAALSAEQTQPVAVKALEWSETCDDSGRYASANSSIGGYDAFELHMTIRGERRITFGWTGHWINGDRKAESFETALTAAQTDYEQRIRSALVDVPAEPVASAWLIEDGTDHAWFTVIPSKAQEAKRKGCVVTPLYTSPPLSREGEDTAEVERVCTEAAMQQWENSTKRPDLAEKDRVRGAIEAYKRQAFAFALAATRSGSAIASKGCAE